MNDLKKDSSSIYYQDKHEINASYYQTLHDEHDGFQQRNWLMTEFEAIQKLVSNSSPSLLEFGCGNGRFLELVLEKWSDVTGVDWARSKYIDDLLQAHPQLNFIQADVTKLKLDKHYDVICSADFLEHLAPEDLPYVIEMLLNSGDLNYHKIACYDDGHSHLSIFPPERWLELFNSQSGGESVKIVHTEIRKKKASNIVVTLANA